MPPPIRSSPSALAVGMRRKKLPKISCRFTKVRAGLKLLRLRRLEFDAANGNLMDDYTAKHMEKAREP